MLQKETFYFKLVLKKSLFFSKRKFAPAEAESPKKTKTLIPLYSCLLCEKSFISTEAVSAHMRIIHNSGIEISI